MFELTEKMTASSLDRSDGQEKMKMPVKEKNRNESNLGTSGDNFAYSVSPIEIHSPISERTMASPPNDIQTS